MVYLDPQKNPTKWLIAVCADLLEQNTEESKTALISAIQTLVNYLEPGLIDQAFAPWIAQCLELLAQHENNQNSALQTCSQSDPQGQSHELQTVDE